jgi:hypothetical protein
LVSGYPDAPHISINIGGDAVVWLDAVQIDEFCACLKAIKKALAKNEKKRLSNGA